MSVQTSVISAPVVAFAGLLADDTENDIMTMVNADTVSMAFGAILAFQTTSPKTDKDAILPAASAAKLAGVVVHSHDYARQFVENQPTGSVTVGELDATGLAVGTELSVLWRGTIWVQVRQAVAVGDRLFVCYAPDGTVYTVKGQAGNADVSTTALDATHIGRFTSSSAAGGFAKLQVDFSQKN